MLLRLSALTRGLIAQHAPRRFRSQAVGARPGVPPLEVPRGALVLGGLGLTPFVWYGSQHESFVTAGTPWGDRVLAKWGGHAGLPLEAWFGCGDQATVRTRFLSYSAVILSFVGAVHWGAAAAAPTSFAATQFGVSVLPALAGWVALSLDRSPRPQQPRRGALDDGGASTTAPHSLLALSFLAVYFFDEAASARKPLAAVPAWFTWLRTPLSTAVVLTHCLAAFAAKDPSVSDRK